MKQCQIYIHFKEAIVKYIKDVYTVNEKFKSLSHWKLFILVLLINSNTLSSSIISNLSYMIFIIHSFGLDL